MTEMEKKLANVLRAVLAFVNEYEPSFTRDPTWPVVEARAEALLRQVPADG